MDSEVFKYAMMEKLVEDWEVKKKKLKNPEAKALVTVDGHSTR
jgi:DNA-binding transcriptional regulator YiaG